MLRCVTPLPTPARRDVGLFESNKTPGDMDGSSTRGVGRTRNLFLNSLVVSSSPTSSTTQSSATGEILLRNGQRRRQSLGVIARTRARRGAAGQVRTFDRGFRGGD